MFCYRYRPLRTVHHCYRTLLTVTESYLYLRYKLYKRYINFLNKTKYMLKTPYITIENGNACKACNSSYGTIG